MVKKELKGILMLLLLISVVVASAGSAFALPDEDDDDDIGEGSGGGGGGLKLETDTFTEDASWDDMDAWKPLAGLVITVFLFLYALSAFVGILASGGKINIATLFKTNDLRSDGQKGIVHILAGIFFVCVAFIGLYLVWNTYGPGSWHP